MQFHARTTIDAPPSEVWDVLVAVDRWPSWDPHVERIDGQVAPGAKVTVHTDLSSRAFPVEVAELSAPHRMVWRGGMPFGLFVGTRTFTLTATDGGTRYDVREEFTGPLTGLIGRTMPDLQPAFDAHVAALKSEVEG